MQTCCMQSGVLPPPHTVGSEDEVEARTRADGDRADIRLHGAGEEAGKGATSFVVTEERASRWGGKSPRTQSSTGLVVT